MKSRLLILLLLLAAAGSVWWWWPSSVAAPEKTAALAKTEPTNPASTPAKSTGLAAPSLPPTPTSAESTASATSVQSPTSKNTDSQLDASTAVRDMLTRLKAGDTLSAFEDYGPSWGRDDSQPEFKAFFDQVANDQNWNMLKVLEAISTQTPACSRNVDDVKDRNGATTTYDTTTATYNITDPVTGQNETFYFFKSNSEPDGRWMFDMNALVQWSRETNVPDVK
jgi:hypothetical protein